MSDKYKILIIDDEEMIRVNLQAYLEDEGYTIFTADSGEAAVDFLEKNEVDIAIVDMRLPNMDGNGVILAGMKIRPNVKFIIHTGSSEYIVPQELLDKGISTKQVLLKPLSDMAQLIETMDKLAAGTLI